MSNKPNPIIDFIAALEAAEAAMTPGEWRVEVSKTCGPEFGTMSEKVHQSMKHSLCFSGREITVAFTRHHTADVKWNPIPFSECGERGLVQSQKVAEYPIDETPHPDASGIALLRNSFPVVLQMLRAAVKALKAECANFKFPDEDRPICHAALAAIDTLARKERP